MHPEGSGTRRSRELRPRVGTHTGECETRPGCTVTSDARDRARLHTLQNFANMIALAENVLRLSRQGCRRVQRSWERGQRPGTETKVQGVYILKFENIVNSCRGGGAVVHLLKWRQGSK